MADGPQIFDYMDPRFRPRPRISTPAFNPNAGSALDQLNNPLGPARPVPSAIPPPSLAPPPSLGLPPEDLPQRPPDPYGEAVERRQTLREAPPTAVPGQPPWWKQILGYAAESFRPTSGMGIGDRLFGVAGAKQEAAERAQELERRDKDVETARGLAVHRRGMSQDVEKIRQFGIEQEGQDRRAGWVVRQPDDPESKFHHVAAPNASGVVMGLLKKESTEAMMTVTADIAKAMGIPVEDGQTEERVSVSAYNTHRRTTPQGRDIKTIGGQAFEFGAEPGSRGIPLTPGETPERNIMAGPGGVRLEALPGSRPGSQLAQVSGDPVSGQAELSPTSVASNKRQIENDYITDIQGARDEYIANTLGSELEPASPGRLWGVNENQQVGIDTATRLWRKRIETASKNRVESYRDVLGEIAPTREDPDLPPVYPGSGL